ALVESLDHSFRRVTAGIHLPATVLAAAGIESLDNPHYGRHYRGRLRADGARQGVSVVNVQEGMARILIAVLLDQLVPRHSGDFSGRPVALHSKRSSLAGRDNADDDQHR